MSKHLLASLLVITACTTSSAPGTVDVDAGDPSFGPSGSFEIVSTFELAAPVPSAAAAVVGTLRDATDGPDDPSRYLVDRIVAALPAGTTRTVAEDLAPLVAAYVQTRLDEIAPHFVQGLDALASGLARLATRFGTRERWWIAPDGAATRAITGLRFAAGTAPVEVELETLGLASPQVGLQVAMNPAHAIAIDAHAILLPYGALLRAGLDRAVIPSVVPGATDLSRALRALVDCDRLGGLVADRLGFGAPALYTTACAAGLTAAAAELYARLADLDASPLALELAGAAVGVDRDGDGAMDAIVDGVWTGAARYESSAGPLGAATFASP